MQRTARLTRAASAVAVITLAAMLIVQNADAGAETVVIVDSTANTDDGSCDPAPGGCTLREAILLVNDGDADRIRFDLTAFSPDTPGVIDLCGDTGEGALPELTRSVVIDGVEAAVVLNGGGDGCQEPAVTGILVEPENDGLDFQLLGGNTFRIEHLACSMSTSPSGGVVVRPAGLVSLPAIAAVDISDVSVEDVCGPGISIEASSLASMSVTDSAVSSTEGRGIAVSVDPCLGPTQCALQGSDLLIMGNQIHGGVSYPNCCSPRAGVSIAYEGALVSSIDTNISGNDIVDGTGNAVEFAFLGCGTAGAVNLHIDDNNTLSGGEFDGAEVSVIDDGCPAIAAEAGSAGFSIDVSVSDNGVIESRTIGGEGGQGVDISILTCCETVDNSATVNVDNNGPITSYFDGVEVDAIVCCGDGNLADISVSGNGDIIGGGDEGVDIVGVAGSENPLISGVAGGPTTANDNTCSIEVNGNGRIDGVGDVAGSPYGVWSECFAGARGLESAGVSNLSVVSVSDNEEIEGELDGIITIQHAGPGHGDPADNLTSTTIERNGLITSDRFDGIQFELDSTALSYIDVTENTISGNPEDGIEIRAGGLFQDADAGVKSVIAHNVISGNGDDGIDLRSISGINVGPGNEIFGNGSDAGGAGIQIDWCLAYMDWASGSSKAPVNQNRITRNSIYNNVGLGIDLIGWDGDRDCEQAEPGVVGCIPFPETGIVSNDCIASPVLTGAADGKLSGTACGGCLIEVYRADGDSSGYGEGAEYLVSGAANAQGDFSLVLCGLDEPGLVTATATDGKNTSEFAANVAAEATELCAPETPTPTATLASPTVTNTPAPPTPTPGPEKLCGDTNESGGVDAIDASLILQLTAGFVASLPNGQSADVNGDGSITSVDASLVLQVTAGLIEVEALSCT